MRAAKPVDLSKCRHLYPFEPHFIELKGLRYHYLDEGAGPPVVMVHGNPTWSFYFRDLVRALSPDFRAIVPDHIGCGLSDKPLPGSYGYRLADRVADFASLLDALRLEDKITLVCHDWGGMIAMAHAVNHSESIGRLILFNTAAFPLPAEKKLPLRLRLVRNLKPLAAPAVVGCNLFALGAAWMASAKGLPRDVRAGLLAPYKSAGNRWATLKFVQDIPVKPGDPSYALVKATADRLHRLAGVPMLICWGMKDFVFDSDYLAQWRRRFPDAAIHQFPEAGHYLLEDQSEAVTEVVKLFLNENPL